MDGGTGRNYTKATMIDHMSKTYGYIQEEEHPMKSFGVSKKAMIMTIDGFDPVYARDLIDSGFLPNIKKFRDRGATTPLYSMQSVMPTYTPPNWCALATGAYPVTSGITDFWNHQSGDQLDVLTRTFDSRICRAEYLQDAADRQGLKTIVAGWPTTWPPTNPNEILIDGSGVHPFLTETIDYERMYTASAENDSVNFVPHMSNDRGAECFETEEVDKLKFEVTQKDAGEQVAESRTIDNGERLGGRVQEVRDASKAAHGGNCDHIALPIHEPKGWTVDTTGCKETVLVVNNGREHRYGLLKATNGVFDTLEIYRRKKDEAPIGTVKLGQWSGPIYDTFTNDDGTKTNAAYQERLLHMAPDGSSFKMYGSFAINMDGTDHVYPVGLRKELFDKFGAPMVFSNCGRDTDDVNTILYESMELACHWVMDVMDYLMDNYEWDVVLQGLHIVDQGNHAGLNDIQLPGEAGQKARDLLNKFYLLADEYVGRCFRWLDQGVDIVICSDHGGLAVYDEESNELGDAWNLNIGVMEKLGYTVLKEENGAKIIDWSKTTAIAQRAMYIYLNMKGREPEGIVDPEDAPALIEKIIDDLYAWRDEKTGRRVVAQCFTREEMEFLNLGGDRVGDITYTMVPDFSHDQGCNFPTVSRAGTSIRALFMAAGPGIKQGAVVDRKVEIVDVAPTLCWLLGIAPPAQCDGGPVYQILED